MNRPANRFTRGSAVYTCRCCKRQTRQTGRGDNDLVGLCVECYELAGEENHLSDNGEFYGSPEEVLGMIATVTEKGGDASPWKDLEARAKQELGQAAPAVAAPAPTEVKVVLQTVAGPVVTAYPIARKTDALVLIDGYMADNKTFTVSYE